GVPSRRVNTRPAASYVQWVVAFCAGDALSLRLTERILPSRSYVLRTIRVRAGTENCVDVDSMVSTTALLIDITESTRPLQTELLVRDGQSVVLGGLTDRQRDVTRRGLPILSSLPFLGGLFGSAERRITETELFVFLTPRVIR